MIRIAFENVHTTSNTITIKDKCLYTTIAHYFLRVHRSYIINTQKNEALTGKDIILQGDIEIPIDTSYKEIVSSINRRYN